MQKILTYLYSNRIEILANLTGYSVEYTNVYQKNVTIYKGIDNVLEFDVKNADQRRIDLYTLGEILMNVMDASGNALYNSPYVVTPIGARGLATVTIPADDLADLDDQYLKFSLTTVKNNVPVILYTDSKFGALGKLELFDSITPIPRKDRVYDTFTAEIDLKGMPIYHSSAIPVKFYEAEPTTRVNFDVYVSGFIGSVWIDATENSTINAEAWKKGGKPYGAWTRTIEDGPYTGVISYGSNISVENYNYLRLSFECPTINGIGSSFTVTRSNGIYDVTIKSGGTGYAVGSQISIPGDQLGGTRGINDLVLTVTGVDASSAGFTSSYAVSSITAVSWAGVAQSGTGTHLVSGINVAGLVDKVVVS